MFTPVKMARVYVVVLRTDLDAVLNACACAGVLHPACIDDVEFPATDLAPLNTTEIASEYEKRYQRVQQLVAKLLTEKPSLADTAPETVATPSLLDIDALLDDIEASVDPLLARRAALVESLRQRNQAQTLMRGLSPAGLPLLSLLRSSYLHYAVAALADSQLPRLKELLSKIPFVMVPLRSASQEPRVLCLVLRRDKPALDGALQNLNSREIALPAELVKTPEEIPIDIGADIERLERELAGIDTQLRQAAATVGPQVREVQQKVDAARVVLRLQLFCKRTDKTCIVTGWVPCDRAQSFTDAAHEATRGRALVETVAADEIDAVRAGNIDVPIQMRNPKTLRPFEELVETFGIPTYRTLDPTVFVAATFLFMFGMMFGDVGHGLVLVVAGLAANHFSPSFSNIGKLAAYCGCSAAVFGVLEGSVFGYETLIPPLWVRPLEGISSLFIVAIAFGVLIVSLGILVNVANAIRTRSWIESLFDTSGPIVGIVYWVAVGLISKAFLSAGGALPMAALSVLLAALLVLFLAKGPVLRLLGREKHMFHDGVATYLMESVVEVLEVLMGYVANTVSFIRVAAFGLAHAGLFVAVFTLAGIIESSAGGPALSWAVVVLGNVLIIILEGLVVTIQALRLEYYEFFGKFFRSTGSKYEPIRFSKA